MSCVSAHLVDALHQALEEQPRIELFLRDDDVDVPESTLDALMDTCGTHDVPLMLAVIPGLLNPEATHFLRTQARCRVELHQHGWQHANHELYERKSEFGPSRSFEQQCQDIRNGKDRMDAAFGDRWFAAFTPPWNRCTDETVLALQALGFSVLSTDGYRGGVTSSCIKQVPITVDLFRWKGNLALRHPDETVLQLTGQIAKGQGVGILLHHKVMDAAALDFLSWLLTNLTRHPHVQFATFHSMTSSGSGRRSFALMEG
jgi:hypothetical protein